MKIKKTGGVHDTNPAVKELLKIFAVNFPAKRAEMQASQNSLCANDTRVRVRAFRPSYSHMQLRELGITRSHVTSITDSIFRMVGGTYYA